MKKMLTSILAGVALMGIVGCSDNEERPELKAARLARQSGTPKELTINLQNDSANYGPEIRFYDLDGDRKTVEQYVEFDSYVMGIHDFLKINLVRPGVEKYPYDSTNVMKTKMRIMTPEEMQKIDSQYQALLEIEVLQEKK